MTFIEAADNVAIAKIGAEISGLGTLSSTILPAIETGRFQKLLKVAPYRTEPHAWTISPWARIVRRAGRYWITGRHVKAYCQPLAIERSRKPEGLQGVPRS